MFDPEIPTVDHNNNPEPGGATENEREEVARKPRMKGETLDIHSAIAMAEQFTLLRLMVPPSIASEFLESETQDPESIAGRLFERWVSKYSRLFRQYCDSLDPNDKDEQALAERLVSGCLTSDDYNRFYAYITDPRHAKTDEGEGGAFFENEDSVREFLEEISVEEMAA